MNHLQVRLAVLRLMWRFVNFWRGSWAVLTLLFGSALAVGLLDYYVHLPSLVRAFALACSLLAGGFVGWRWLIQPLKAPCDDQALAMRIEAAHPELNDSLASTVAFLERDDDPNCSAAMRKKAIEQGLEAIQEVGFSKILGLGSLAVVVALASLVMIPSLFVWWRNPSLAQTGFARFFDPLGTHTWTRLHLEETPRKLAQGQPFVLRGEIDGILPQSIRVEVDGVARADKMIAVKASPDKQSAKFVAPFDMTLHKGSQKFRFRLLANDATFPPRGGWHEVEVLPPPKLAQLNGLPSPQVELYYPEYTDLSSPAKLSPGQGHVEAVAGTQIKLLAAVDRPVARAWIDLKPRDPLVQIAATVGPMGHTDLFNLASLFAVSQAVAGKTPCKLSDNRLTLEADFRPWMPGQYTIHLEDADGLSKDYIHDLRIFPDPAPTVQLQRPATRLSLVPDAQVTFKMVVEDELFAVRSVALEVRRKNAEGKWLEDTPVRLPIFEPDVVNRHLPHFLAKLGGIMIPAGEGRLRPKRLELFSRWPLANRYQEGDTLYLQVVADDWNNLFIPSPLGRSHEIELRIVGKRELSQALDQDFAKIQEEIENLRKFQQEALDKVKDVEDNRDRKGSKNHDQIVEAEQKQKEIQARIGPSPDTGLRQELANLKQKMRDNKIKTGDLQQRLDLVKNELERLAQETLPDLENKLIEVRKEMAGLTKPAPNKQQDPLAKAGDLQKDAKATLDELAKSLEPWAKMHQLKGNLNDLLGQQKELKKDIERLQQQLADKPGDKDLQAELQRKAEQQAKLAKAAEELLGTMRSVQGKMGEKQEDPLDQERQADAAAKIGEAIKTAEKDDAPKDDQGNLQEKKGPLTSEMKQAAERLKKQELADAIKNSQNAIDRMEKMQANLDERRDQDLEKLQKKQKQAEAKLDELREKMDILQKKVQKAQQIADPKQREAELKKLAKEQDRLKEDAQEQARELARLQAEQAAKELQRAAQQMDRAARQLEAGENPEDNQQEALDRLDQAVERLEEAEEELAREQLAQIADQIKGIKERQEAAQASNERIHNDMKRKGQWTRGLHQSLRDSAKVQKTLAEETDLLKEKIKDAKVFEHILDRAQSAMDRAKVAINERAENVDYEPLDKEAVADEEKMQKQIAGAQKDALGRLQRLLDALKNDPAMAKAEQNDDPEGGMPPGGDEPMGGFKSQDGIPQQAQIKALRDEQTDLKRRTEEFAKDHPDQTKLTPQQQEVLRELKEEQAQLHRLFHAITAQKGEMP